MELNTTKLLTEHQALRVYKQLPYQEQRVVLEEAIRRVDNEHARSQTPKEMFPFHRDRDINSKIADMIQNGDYIEVLDGVAA